MIADMPHDPRYNLTPRGVLVGSYVLADSRPSDLDVEVFGVSRAHLSAVLETMAGVPYAPRQSNATPVLAGKSLCLATVHISVEMPPDAPAGSSPADYGTAHVVAFTKLEDGTRVQFTIPHYVARETRRYNFSSVTEDPLATFEAASARRLLAHHSAGFDPLTRETIDPRGALNALAWMKLSILDKDVALSDPLNIYHCLSEAARYCLVPDAPTLNILREMVDQPIPTNPLELLPNRLNVSRAKLLSTGRPSETIRLALEIGLLARDFPLLDKLASTNPSGFNAVLRCSDSALQTATDQSSWTLQERQALVLGRMINIIREVTPTVASNDSDLACFATSFCYAAKDGWSHEEMTTQTFANSR